MGLHKIINQSNQLNPAGRLLRPFPLGQVSQVDQTREHLPQQIANECRTLLQAGVTVGLYQPHFVVLVQQKIIAQQLECFCMIQIDQSILYTVDALPHNFNYILEKLFQIQRAFFVFLVEVLYHTLQRELVAFAKLSVLLGILLNCVVGEVYKLIIDVGFLLLLDILFVLLQILFLILFLFLVHNFVLNTCQSDVTLFEEVCFEYFFSLQFYELQHHPKTHIKFISVYEQWTIDVFLNNVGHRSDTVAVHFDTYFERSFAQQFGKLFECGEEMYSSASVEVGRLKYPQMLITLIFFLLTIFDILVGQL